MSRTYDRKHVKRAITLRKKHTIRKVAEIMSKELGRPIHHAQIIRWSAYHERDKETC